MIDKSTVAGYHYVKIRKLIGAGRKARGHRERGCSSPFPFRAVSRVNKQNTFTDESGHFGEWDEQTSYAGAQKTRQTKS